MRRKPQTIRLYTTLSSLNFIHVLSRLQNIKHAVSKLNSTNVVGGHPDHKRFCDILMDQRHGRHTIGAS